MRTLILALVLASPAVAQPAKVWTPAPVSGLSQGSVSPADRAGPPSAANGAGTDNSSPFSAAPSGSQNSGGQSSPATRDTPGSTAAGTPNLSR